MTSFFRSFLDAVMPPPPQRAPEGRRPRSASVGSRPRAVESRPEGTGEPQQMGSRTDLEQQTVTDNPEVLERVGKVEVEDLGPSSDEDEQERRNPLDPGDFASQITVRRPRPRLTPTAPPEEDLGLEDSEAPETTGEEESEGAIGGLLTGDIIEDAKFYQDVAVELQTAYDTLENRFTQQARLMEEASGALHAAESEASKRQRELLKLQRDHETNVEQAVGRAVSEYKEQLTAAKQRQQFKDRKHQQTVHQLQDRVRALELSLASQATLPSVRHTKEEADLREEIFNYLPGTVNARRGAAVYESQDQPLSFQKHVRFGDRSRMPDLKSDDTDSEDPQIIPPTIPRSSTPHRGKRPRNETFDVSHIPNLTNVPHDAAAIAAEVSAAAAAQASKEFRRMRDPKITKFKGGYSADAELTFRSWRADILTHIQDRELDNKAAIQLIKDMTLDNARREVEYQLDICGGIITYQDLLKHLSVTFQGGDEEANLIAEFYSRGQKTKETEEAFADELQILARKVMTRKPNFRHDLDSTLKQRYASQLSDKHSASIAKTLLKQMPKISFTEFRNELSRVLGTRQKAAAKASVKAVSATTTETESESEPVASKPRSKHIKKDGKISAQASQIKELRSKLDEAIAENSQMREYFSPTSLQTAFTNALQAAGKSKSTTNTRPGSQPFQGKRRPSQLSAGIDGTTDPEKTCNYCKDTGHWIRNCLRLQARKVFLKKQEEQAGGLN